MLGSCDDALKVLTQGAQAVYTEEELRSRLMTGRPLRVKLGLDPTAPDIHLGHTVVLRKLRQFQDLGHVAVLIIGDYTARIGDPSGRDTTRPILDEATIAANARTYLEQAGKILDTSPSKLELHHNSRWLGSMTLEGVLRMTGLVTVQQMLHRENFARRMELGREIMLSEFIYPLMQAYDSVAIRADVELGGTDQTFNCLLGRQLMPYFGLEKQIVLVMPILTGLDGKEKMSKSKGNYVAVTDPPDEMFGKIMSISDELMPQYYQLLTDLPPERIRSLLDPAVTHPREAKDVLARVIVEQFYGREAAEAASAEFRRRFSEGRLPSQMPVITATRTPMGIVDLIRLAGFAPSNSEARRLVEQGAVEVDGQRITDPRACVPISQPVVLQVGKRRICRVQPPA